ncbi:MAG: hypothetical protein FWG42_01645 [Clostridiales bacterium]|nr:hypothetical protein [Clostridiales bacterium]
MFCRYCGKQVHNDSIFCSFCGKQLTENGNGTENEEAALNAPFRSDPEFVWNLHEFPEHKKTEDIDFSWAQSRPKNEITEFEQEAEAKQEAEIKQKAEIKQEAEGYLFKTPEPLKYEVPEIVLGPPQYEMPEIKLEPWQDSKIDRFYTFNKKNEEFQKLLDKEYERVKNKEFSEPAEEPEPEQAQQPAPMPEHKPQPTPMPEHKPQPAPMPEFEPQPAPMLEFEPEQAQLDTQAEDSLIYDNDTLSKRFDTREFNKDLIEVALEKAGIIIDKEYEISQERDAYKSDFKPRFIEESHELELMPEPEPKPEPDLRPEPELRTGRPEPGREPSSIITDILPLADPQKQEAFKALEKLWDAEERSAREKKSVRKTEKSEKAEYFKGAEQTEGESVKEEGGSESKRDPKKILLTVLLIVFSLEVAALGLKYFAPNSIGAAFVNSKLSFAVTWFDSFFHKEPLDETGSEDLGILEGEDEDDGDGDGDAEDMPAAPIREPEANKAFLIASQLYVNRNIEAVGADDDLKFNSENTYSEPGVAASKPIEDNIWRMEDGNAVYYDQAVVASLISFNSKWIDYVNSGDETILGLVKEGGQAEKSILDFKRGSGVKKAFKLLQIGELRQSGDTFFIWTREVIEDTVNGKTTENTYNWVYQMEAAGDKMQVVGYFRN